MIHARPDISDIDAEIDLQLDQMFDAVTPFTRVATQSVDQAARLRGLMQQSPAPQHPPQQSSPRQDMISAARSARVIAIASGKGGVGKTNISVNLAIALAERGLRVTLLDADLGTANADLLCGVIPHARLDHILAPAGLGVQDGASRSIRDIAIRCPGRGGVGGFDLIPGSAGVARMADLSPGERRWLLNALVELASETDVLLIDAAAGIGPDVTTLLASADLALVVTTPEPTALADAYALIKCLASVDHFTRDDRAELALVVNQTRSPAEAFATHARLAQVCDRFLATTIPMLGFVAHDLRVPEAVRAQCPLLVRTPDTPASHNLRELAGSAINLLGLSTHGATASASTPPTPGGLRRLVRRLLGDSRPPRTIGRFSTESARVH
ncbi:MAG: MinD/ParA family protein [Phycisphaerales bacterium]|nr:MinD/ParA family protein [Phycisphaerales bacterium]